MRLFAILSAAAALLISGCAPTSTTVTTPDAVQEAPAELWTADTRAVLVGDAARTLSHQCSRISPGPVSDVWTPTDAQIEALEDGLILLLAQRLEGEDQQPSPGDYYRQYAGFVIGGKRVIYVNGFASSVLRDDPAQPFDWHTQAVQICDGGTITFGAEYDVATGQFANFAFNGAP